VVFEAVEGLTETAPVECPLDLGDQDGLSGHCVNRTEAPGEGFQPLGVAALEDRFSGRVL
jgi:hypothetical protein